MRRTKEELQLEMISHDPDSATARLAERDLMAMQLQKTVRACPKIAEREKYRFHKNLLKRGIH